MNVEGIDRLQRAGRGGARQLDLPIGGRARGRRPREVVVSAPILAEYREVGRRPKHLAHHGPLRALTEALAAVAAVVEPARARFGLADPDDEVYLATALAGGARALVTGNRRHFVQDRYGNVKILSPHTFVDRTA